MTQEEKAKRYDEALEESKKWYKAFVVGHNYPATDIKVSYEWIFPEIKESESEDEKIRKRLIFDFQSLGKTEWGGLEVKDILAWLEKQGEQKSADSYCQENCKGFQETGKCFADGECKAKREAEQNPA